MGISPFDFVIPCAGEKLLIGIVSRLGTRCRYEFCWECLADWKLIAPDDPEDDTYNVEAHKTACPFRTNGVVPTHISGTTLEEALRS